VAAHVVLWQILAARKTSAKSSDAEFGVFPVRAKKARPIIAAKDIEIIFTDALVAQLANCAKLPPGTNMIALAEGVREAARIFVRDAGFTTPNELHNDIAELQKSADQVRQDKIIALWEDLSPRARDILKDRAGRLGIELPSSDALRDSARRDGACETIARLCQFGGQYVAGRDRPFGKQSRPTWRPRLYAPDRQRNSAKRNAERNFVIWLSIAWQEATGAAAARTARHGDASRNVGPFARFARECLNHAGAPDADIVELMNELHRRRREMERRSAHGSSD
jgi:hypothetical protein